MSARSRFLALALPFLLVGCSEAEPEAGAMDEAAAFVPPRDTDVLLADLGTGANGLPTIGSPQNLTQRPDYDNQPYFTPDGTGLWYTANDPQSGQSDIWRYDFAEGRVTRVTMSAPESEYSATPLPDGSGISAIRVEADSAQRLWRFDADGSNGAVILPDVAPVGYHKWVDETTLVMFVLGNPATLQVGDTRTGRARVVTSNIGRSIHNIPGRPDVSYVQIHDDGTTTIMRLRADGSDPEPIVDGIDDGDYHAWTPDGVLLQASGAVVYAHRPGSEPAWQPVADFSDLHIVISRLAVSPDGRQIAMVAELDAIELPAN